MSQNFKPALLAAALTVAFAGSTLAADIEIYGRMDSGLKYTHVNGTDKVEMRYNRATPRVGMNIVEKLNEDVKVKVYLETGFKADTGELGTANTLFDRRSILAVQSNTYGELGMGRMGTVQSTVAPYSMGLLKYDPFATSYGQASIGTGFANTNRSNNAFTWISPTWEGWKVGATYSLGNSKDDTIDNYAGRDHTLALATDYTSQDLYLSLTYAMVAWGDEDSNKTMKDDAHLFGIGGWYNFTPAFRGYFGTQYSKHWTGAAGANVKTSDSGAEAADQEGGFDGYSLLLGATYTTGAHKVLADVKYYDGELSKNSRYDYKLTVLAAAYEYKLAPKCWLYFAATQSFADGLVHDTLKKDNKDKETTEFMIGLNYNF